ncbi:MAG: Ig-like domain-containing protein [Marinilabiliales bacterium]|nr:Ig-like domain-containing protein [Marinilabiliales bacterium]
MPPGPSRRRPAAATPPRRPSVSFTAAPAGPTYTSAQSVTLTAVATDNVGVSRVEFYDGATLKGTDTSTPFSFSWAITAADNGTHNWTARAYDAANNVRTSAVLPLTVNIAVTPPTPPNVSINSTSQSCGGSGQPVVQQHCAVAQQPAPALVARETPVSTCWRSTTSACTAAIWTPASPASCRRSTCSTP